jgi:hypothetical protein
MGAPVWRGFAIRIIVAVTVAAAIAITVDVTTSPARGTVTFVPDSPLPTPLPTLDSGALTGTVPPTNTGTIAQQICAANQPGGGTLDIGVPAGLRPAHTVREALAAWIAIEQQQPAGDPGALVRPPDQWQPVTTRPARVQYADFVGGTPWMVDVTARGGRWRVTAVVECV